jgi:hypothetical protein
LLLVKRDNIRCLGNSLVQLHLSSRLPSGGNAIVRK